MKKAQNSNEEMMVEYDFDYKKAKENRFAREYSVTVTLDPDVAEVFSSSESVNRALRAVISAIPKSHKTHDRHSVQK